MKLQSASKKELRRISAGTAVLDLILVAGLFLMSQFDMGKFDLGKILLSALIGSTVAILSFTILCLTIQSAVGMEDRKKRKAKFQLSYNARMILQAGWIVTAFLLPEFHFLAGAAPVFFPKLTILYLQAKGKLLRNVDPHDLVKFGLIPELIGRIPVITALDPLDEDALIRVLHEPKNSLLRQYEALFKMDNVALEFTQDALRAIAGKAVELNSGARGLRSITEKLLMPIMYQIPSDPSIIKVIITKETVEGGEPTLEYGAAHKRYKNGFGH